MGARAPPLPAATAEVDPLLSARRSAETGTTRQRGQGPQPAAKSLTKTVWSEAKNLWGLICGCHHHLLLEDM